MRENYFNFEVAKLSSLNGKSDDDESKFTNYEIKGETK